jgi:hypothetical protein
MSDPTTHTSAEWVRDELSSAAWIPVRDVLLTAYKKKLPTYSEDRLADLIEERLIHVADELRGYIDEWVFDGSVPLFEIDNDPSPYIRLMAALPSDLKAKLHRIQPSEFEQVCADILGRLGGKAQAKGQPNDGGVDFVAFHLSVVPTTLSMPLNCRAVVIGQAKRYKDGNTISETQLREFVGAATLEKHKRLRDGNIGPLSPVIFAFWTTSTFDQNARRFARDLGLWYMDGLTLAGYVATLGLRESVMALADVVI